MISVRCWWLGHEPDYFDQKPEPDCIHCGRSISYDELVSDCRQRRVLAMARHWLLRKWWPAKCGDCGRRFKCDDRIDHIPF